MIDFWHCSNNGKCFLFFFFPVVRGQVWCNQILNFFFFRCIFGISSRRNLSTWIKDPVIYMWSKLSESLAYKPSDREKRSPVGFSPPTLTVLSPSLAFFRAGTLAVQHISTLLRISTVPSRPMATTTAGAQAHTLDSFSSTRAFLSESNRITFTQTTPIRGHWTPMTASISN